MFPSLAARGKCVYEANLSSWKQNVLKEAAKRIVTSQMQLLLPNLRQRSLIMFLQICFLV